MSVLFGLTNLLGGLLVIALAVPLVAGKVPMNYWYGARFPASFRSQEAWYAINRHAGRLLIIWGVPLTVSGAVAFFVSFDESSPLVWVFTAVWAGLFLVVVQSWRYAKSI